MKIFKFFLLFCLMAIVFQAYSQTDKATTKKIVEGKNYTFVANSAMPLAAADISKILNSIPGGQGGGVINLTGSGYTLRVTADSVLANLPYYGRSYQAPLNPSDAGIKFTSTKFKYQETKGKKGSYTIKLDTQDNKGENYRLVLNISQNGYATLVANSIYKQPITYQGFLQEPKKK